MKLRMFVVGILGAALVGCGGDLAPTAGTATAFTAACDKTNDGKRIAVEGYLRLPDSFTGDRSVVLRLHAAPDFGGNPVGVQTALGKEANQVENVPKQFSDDDLKVHTADGSLATFGTKVNVSGKVYYPTVSQDFACGLENPLIELAK